MLLIKTLLGSCFEPPSEIELDSEQNRAIYLYSLYLKKMKETGRIDYEGMLYFSWVLLGRKQVFKHYSIVYKYLCVDEYQDTNLSQYNIITRLLSDDNPNLFIVADDDQIIYQWNGASPERLKSIIAKYEMQVLQLPENYRCPPDVVNIANKMIENNANRFPSKSQGISINNKPQKDVVTIKNFDCLENEILWVIKDIKDKSRVPKDTVILGRNHKLLNDTKSILAKQGINAVIHQRKNEFASFPMCFLHSLLRLYSTRSDKVYLQRLLSSFYQIEGVNVDYYEIIGQSSFTGGDFLRAWSDRALNNAHISDITKDYITSINNDKYYTNFTKLIEITFNWLDKLEDDNNHDIYSNYKEEKKTFELLKNDINSISNMEISLIVFLQELDLRDKSEPVPDDAFELITIHGAKGLEFQNVYLIGMVNDILPSYNSIKQNARVELLEEERRSCYVAITRTQQTLTITFSSRYWGWQKEPSLFLYEMGLLEQ
jgi:DNA helicase-2/ATP-dependent DNA helicase PcrA